MSNLSDRVGAVDDLERFASSFASAPPPTVLAPSLQTSQQLADYSHFRSLEGVNNISHYRAHRSFLQTCPVEMSAIRLATAANVRAFQSLVHALSTSDPSLALDLEALQDELGRLRVWCGNIGALQKGHSSLDYRLRDSPLLSSNVLKLLQELEENVNAGIVFPSMMCNLKLIV